jgi:hypothetical protein
LQQRENFRFLGGEERQIMMSKGLWKRRRARKEDHAWRERKHHVGKMVQMDGSHHDWLEVRESRPVEPKPAMVKPRRKPPKYNPPPTHPWRQMIFGNGLQL